MGNLRALLALTASISLVTSQGCPFGHTAAKDDVEQDSTLEKRAALDSSANILSQFIVNDTDVYLTSDAGGPIEDQNSLSAGERGPTLLEDFIFRQKITHFDHERVSANYVLA
jgi:catalase